MKQFQYAVFISFASIALLTSCAGNPATGGSSVVFSTRGGEITIGEEEHRKLAEAGQLYEDPELQAYIDRVGQRLVATSDMPELDFTFSVIDSEMINAFALPGGYVYISRGLLPYMDNEAELAGVLAHEIAHVTARHHGRQRTGSIANQIAAITAYILTGSSDIAQASTMYGAELMSGFGREMELEADGLGAQYMHASGYDPEAMLEVIGVLKNQEQYQRVKAKSSGKPAGTYHGLYATHPRNDKRLQTVIQTAADMDLDEYVEDPELPGEFRRHLEGVAWGPTMQREENRFYHNKLAFSFERPEEWEVASGSSSIVASAPGGDPALTITLRRRDPASTPQKVLEDNAGGELSSGKKLEQAGLAGYTAISSSAQAARRLAVIDYGNLSYLFEGKAQDLDSSDPQLLAIIESFRPLHPREKETGPPLSVHYIQVPRGATMESLAASIRIPDAENQLRLINGFYPRGEPRTGDWIKVIK